MTQDGGTISEELSLDEGMYSDLLPVSYPPQSYTGHKSWDKMQIIILQKK